MRKTLLEYMEEYNFENLVVCQHKKTGLKAFIGIHDTTLGPAVGGCRMWTYARDEDALRLLVFKGFKRVSKNSRVTTA